MVADGTIDTITAYQANADHGMTIVPSPIARDWMDRAPQRAPYRCLPLNIANQNGWWITAPVSIEAFWYGGERVTDVEIRFRDRPHSFVSSHFGNGVVTFSVPFVFRTPPGINLWVKGPSNFPRDGATALEGVVETDWAVSTFTMNWKLTRPNEWIPFGAGEPFCQIVPVPRGLTESFTPDLKVIDANPELADGYRNWAADRRGFLSALSARDPDAIKRGWQKDYTQGKTPTGATFAGHQTRLDVKPFPLEPTG